jgi:hypothetical protein
LSLESQHNAAKLYSDKIRINVKVVANYRQDGIVLIAAPWNSKKLGFYEIDVDKYRLRKHIVPKKIPL